MPARASVCTRVAASAPWLLLAVTAVSTLAYRSPRGGTPVAFVGDGSGYVAPSFDSATRGLAIRQPARERVGLAVERGSEVVNDGANAEPKAPDAVDSAGYDCETLGEAFTYGANEPMLKQIRSRCAKLRLLERELGVNPYPEIQAVAAADLAEMGQVAAAHRDLEKGDEVEGLLYRVHGRIMSIRFDGMFVVLQDSKGGELQIMFRKKGTVEVAGTAYESGDIGRIIDIGDVIEVRGHVKKTSSGEITLVAHSLTVLAKCLLPMPDGFHGLKDVSTRMRLRHLDIMTNKDVRKQLLQRSKMVWLLRRFLHDRGFVEVETPILYHGYSGANATPFETKSEALDEKLYLRIAPEFFLKRLITGGLADKVFEIGKCFRNEGTSTRHSPEFTMVEMYQQLADARDMMRLMEELVAALAEGLGVATPTFKTQSMRDLIEIHTGIDVGKHDREGLMALLAERWADAPDLAGMTWGDLVCALFKQEVEDRIVDPVHVTELPAEVAPLASASGAYGRVFESYIGGMEVAHGCTEQCHPLELLRKLDGCRLEGLGHARDKEFLNAVAYGMPPTGGLGVGVDRLLMALTGTSSIKNAQTFPLLKNVY
ncbi:lysine--tRNA ligase [Babesia caballi]|uniref:Lysyl-tRNA synthetase n=1 Tax=Babesia caballi TaxID=5871 RepID=A0AAV4LZS1_BABCB|nr:lysine--tRNA ligase [Babesia caballi]